MATKGTNITKQSVADDYNANVRNRITYTYSASNVPKIPSGYSRGDIYPERFGSSFPAIGSGDVASSSTITATDVVNNLIAFTKNYFSQIRNINIVCRNEGDNSNINSTTTARALLTTSYTQSIPTVNIGAAAGQIISTPSYSAIYDVWSTASRNKAFDVVFYRHASHHSHGSRLRR